MKEQDLKEEENIIKEVEWGKQLFLLIYIYYILYINILHCFLMLKISVPNWNTACSKPAHMEGFFLFKKEQSKVFYRYEKEQNKEIRVPK